MSYVYDFKGRRYEFNGADQQFTFLTCTKTRAKIKVANTHFLACGFKPL